MRGSRARRLRQEPLAAFVGIVRRYSNLGRCPNCHRPRARFTSLHLPGDETVQFACRGCSPEVDRVFAQAQAERAAWRRCN